MTDQDEQHFAIFSFFGRLESFIGSERNMSLLTILHVFLPRTAFCKVLRDPPLPQNRYPTGSFSFKIGSPLGTDNYTKDDQCVEFTKASYQRVTLFSDGVDGALQQPRQFSMLRLGQH